MKLGEFFIKNNLADRETIQQALELQSRTGGRLGDILSALTHMRSIDFYQTLANHYSLEYVNLMAFSVDYSLLSEEHQDHYYTKLYLPIQYEQGQYMVATANPSIATFSEITQEFGENTKIVATSKLDILWILQERFKQNYLDYSINTLINNNIHFSAKKVLSRWQLFILMLFLTISLYCVIVHPIGFFITLNLMLMFALSVIILYKIILAIITLLITIDHKVPEIALSHSMDLPIYTILIPVYDEKEIVLKNLFLNLQKIEYPKHKLDVKVLLEKDDHATIAILKKLKLPSYIEYIYIPAGHPRTKAKACNYGLKFARGEFITLYDAEDRPDPFQLLLAVNTFKGHKDQHTACLQSRLNFYNSDENWLTRMFTLEYSYWFDLLLPALEYLRTPVPLGGTSNHFRTDILKKIDAWDPYNVAEDADVGIRLHRLGYTTNVISSTTYEEANCHLINWIKQRTRWIKGYMQTYLVHMRHPFSLWRALGTRGFLGFQMFIGGTVLSNLSTLLLWSICFIFLFMPADQIRLLFPGMILNIAIFNFCVGTVGVIFLNLLGILKRKRYELTFSAFTAPIYWLLMSIASYRALYQLILKPSYWDKTEHGISKKL